MASRLSADHNHRAEPRGSHGSTMPRQIALCGGQNPCDSRGSRCWLPLSGVHPSPHTLELIHPPWPANVSGLSLPQILWENLSEQLPRNNGCQLPPGDLLFVERNGNGKCSRAGECLWEKPTMRIASSVFFPLDLRGENSWLTPCGKHRKFCCWFTAGHLTPKPHWCQRSSPTLLSNGLEAMKTAEP